MEHPRPVLPSQRYSPTDDCTYDGGHQDLIPTRQPLGESTGNVQPQPHSFPSMSLCHPGHLSISPPVQSIPTPPIVPTQALASAYGTALRATQPFHRNGSIRDSQMGHSSGSKNPIYAYKHFADYRNKVMQKELEKEQPTWPLWLEDAFLDALLLIPQMGRKKFSSKTVLYGRNMLITEYLWTYHWLLHPPPKGERVPVGKERENWICKDQRTCSKDGSHRSCKKLPHPMYRGRKQVSSHIQVLKGFFATLVTFHFIFPSRKDIKDDDKRFKEEDETESFKNNRVLISIADGRLPDERPNYEYFARLLSADNDVFVRPKQCWIFVSSSKVNLKAKHVTSEDGSTRKQITGYTSDGIRLSESDYPHLKLNDSKDYKDLPRTGDRATVLLHEYTKTLAQKESASVKDVSPKWEVRFPDLLHKLTQAHKDTRPSDERTSRCVVGPCDTFQFDVVLDLHANSKFPIGSELNGMVELSISRTDLHNHSWRSSTSVVKPEELYINDSEPELRDRTNAVDVITSHRVGCNALPGCDCAGRGSRDTICVPFPAASWANTFIKLAPFVSGEQERKRRARAEKAGGIKQEEGDEASGSSTTSKSPSELLQQVAMYQEIWSTPNDSNGDLPPESETCTYKPNGNWTRRAVLLWTFSPMQDGSDDKTGNSVPYTPGTSWRFLTKRDPTSQYHQQRAYLSGSPQIISRNTVTSPDPGYAHHVNAAMHENFSAAYDSGPSITLPGQQHAHLASTGMAMNNMSGLLDGFPNGLATPPPTAGIGGSHHGGAYNDATGYHGSTDTEDLSHLDFLGDGSTTNCTAPGITPSSLVGADPPHHHHAADPFMAGLDSVVPVSSGGSATYNDSTTADGLQAWAQGGLGNLDMTQWDTSASNGYVDASRAPSAHGQNQHHQHHHVDSWNEGASPATAEHLKDMAQWAISTAGTPVSVSSSLSGPSGGTGPHDHFTPDTNTTATAAATNLHDATDAFSLGGGGGDSSDPTSSLLRGRKRPLSDTLDDDSDFQQRQDANAAAFRHNNINNHGGNIHNHNVQQQHHHHNQHLASMRKLSHQPHHSSQPQHHYASVSAPTAVMDDGSNVSGAATPTFM